MMLQTCLSTYWSSTTHKKNLNLTIKKCFLLVVAFCQRARIVEGQRKRQRNLKLHMQPEGWRISKVTVPLWKPDWIIWNSKIQGGRGGEIWTREIPKASSSSSSSAIFSTTHSSYKVITVPALLYPAQKDGRTDGHVVSTQDCCLQQHDIECFLL